MDLWKHVVLGSQRMGEAHRAGAGRSSTELWSRECRVPPAPTQLRCELPGSSWALPCPFHFLKTIVHAPGYFLFWTETTWSGWVRWTASILPLCECCQHCRVLKGSQGSPDMGVPLGKTLFHEGCHMGREQVMVLVFGQKAAGSIHPFFPAAPRNPGNMVALF